MEKKIKVKVPAIKEKGTKKIVEAPSEAYSHEELEIKEGRGKKEDKRGFLLSNGEFVGEIEAYPVRPQVQPWTEWGVGYSLNPSHWRKGYATEGLIAVIQAVFEHPDAMRIKADVGDVNQASIGLLTKLGFEPQLGRM